MKVSKAQAAANRERILAESAQLFRERGFAGIGVADLMKSAGLTHGGFYGHFQSKDDLIAQASARTLAETLEEWKQVAAQADETPLAAFMAAYLTPEHRDNPGEGCLLAALGAEIAREGAPVRRAVTEGLQAIVAVLAEAIPVGSESERRADVLAMYASAVGTLVLARAVDDPALSDEILAATARALEKNTTTGDK
jgi:TetR/AcrR family transcriptional repressor of nem operon